MEPQPTNTTELQVQRLRVTDGVRTLFKGLVIALLMLLLLIPLFMISDLVRERQARQEQVITEVSNKWATRQTLTGPLLYIPYLVPVGQGKPPIKNHLYLLPEQLQVIGQLLPEVRHRSLYEVTLYRSGIALSGSFRPEAVQKLGIAPEQVLWGEAQMILGLDDVRGLEEEVTAGWGTGRITFDAGVPDVDAAPTGLSAKAPMAPTGEMRFVINMKLRGSGQLYFTPVGNTTSVTLTSPWKDPAFDGQYLPAHSAIINDSGFTAQWKVLKTSRAYPQAWKDNAISNIHSSAFGVKLIQPTDSYAKTDRSVKYAMLIISLTFAIFFFVELFQKKQMHPLQYVLVAVALCVFYTLLLSISEYTGFNTAYLIAAVATVALISLYVSSIFKKTSIAIGFAAALGALYTYIFVLIQLQDYALLCGSIGLFVILAIIMFYSRKIDWYGLKNTNNEPATIATP